MKLNILNQLNVYIIIIYSFLQSTLVCDWPINAIPCEESEAFMDGPTSINARFGVVEDFGEKIKRK